MFICFKKENLLSKIKLLHENLFIKFASTKFPTCDFLNAVEKIFNVNFSKQKNSLEIFSMVLRGS